MAEVTDQKSSKKTSPRRRVASTNDHSNQTFETPCSSPPTVPAHPHSEPTALATSGLSPLAAEDLKISKTRTTTKRRTSKVDALVSSVRSSPPTDSSLPGVVPTMDDSALSETPCPPRQKAAGRKTFPEDKGDIEDRESSDLIQMYVNRNHFMIWYTFSTIRQAVCPIEYPSMRYFQSNSSRLLDHRLRILHQTLRRKLASRVSKESHLSHQARPAAARAKMKEMTHPFVSNRMIHFRSKDLVGPIHLGDLAHLVISIDPMDPTYPMDPTDHVNLTYPASPTDPASPTYLVDPTDLVNPTDPASPTYLVNLTDPVDPTDLVNLTYPVDPIDLGNPTDPKDPTDLVNPTDPASPTYLVGPSFLVNPTHPMEPTSLVNPTYPMDPTNPVNPTDPLIPISLVGPTYPVLSNTMIQLWLKESNSQHSLSPTHPHPVWSNTTIHLCWKVSKNPQDPVGPTHPISSHTMIHLCLKNLIGRIHLLSRIATKGVGVPNPSILSMNLESRRRNLPISRNPTLTLPYRKPALGCSVA